MQAISTIVTKRLLQNIERFIYVLLIKHCLWLWKYKHVRSIEKVTYDWFSAGL